MSISNTFDGWAANDRDREMEARHWNTAKHVLARMPVESDDTIVDLGTGSGYAVRALTEVKGPARAYGLDASPQMVRNARSYTNDDPEMDSHHCGYLSGDFARLPFDENAIDHVFSMEAFYYAPDPHAALEEIQRCLRTGGTFFCAVNYYEENVYSHDWPDWIDVEMTRWDRNEYRRAFRQAGFSVAEQDLVADLDVEIPPASAFPTEDFETRDAMVERYRELGTLLTVGVVR